MERGCGGPGGEGAARGRRLGLGVCGLWRLGVCSCCSLCCREVRENAAEALGKIGDVSAVPPLTEALRHDMDEDVRQRGGASCRAGLRRTGGRKERHGNRSLLEGLGFVHVRVFALVLLVFCLLLEGPRGGKEGTSANSWRLVFGAPLLLS